jgi:purine-binding chemotaxis protein CheW
LQGVAKVESDLLLLLNPDTLLRRAEEVAMLAWEAELDYLSHSAAVNDLNPRLLTPNSFYELYCPEASEAERTTFRERAEELRRSPDTSEAEALITLAVVKLEPRQRAGIHHGATR